MNPQVCVICCNKKPVNQTSNRLVTESCGHVKCMDCLLVETAGCAACLKRDKHRVSEQFQLDEDEASLLSQCAVTTEEADLLDNNTEDPDKLNGIDKKKKPETAHIKIETDANGRCYMCTVCKKRFHARSQVAYHAYCNGQRKPYQCPECNKSFATHSHFKYHMRVHRNERTYACEACGDSFFQMSKLQRHKLKHTKEKKFACSECSKAFNNLPALRKHGLTHTEERPYSCDTCGQRFRDSSNFRKHAAKHLGKECGGVPPRSAAPPPRAPHERRAFQCPRCPQAFRSKKDMRRHSAVHSDSKPFRCKVCDRRFRRKDNLERHIRNTHPDYVTSSAIEFDERALTEQQTSSHPPTDLAYGNVEKTKLEILNPLPPPSPDLIQRHLRPQDGEKPTTDKIKFPMRPETIEKSYILEANNARESVICVNRKEVLITTKKEEWNDEHQYVHKIKKLNYWAREKDITLPPVDASTLTQFLDRKDDISNDVVVPPKNPGIYKKFFFDEKKDAPDLTSGHEAQDSEGKANGAAAEMHWRKKKLNITWYDFMHSL